MGKDEIELRDYVRGIWGEKWLILAVFLLTVGVAAGVSWGLPLQYATETTLLIAPRVSEQLAGEGEPFVGTLSAETYENLALANDLLQEVIAALDLRESPGQPDSKPLAVESLRRQMRAEVVVGAGQRSPGGFRFPLLTVRVRGTDPEQIGRIANKWAELFIQRNTRLLETAVAQSYEFIAQRFVEIEEELKAKEKAREQYERENSLELLQSKLWVLRDRYEGFLSQLQDKRLELAEKQAHLAGLRAALAKESPLLELKRSISTEALWEMLTRRPSPEELLALAGLSLTEQELNQVYLSLKERLVQTEAEVTTLTEGVRYLEEKVQQFEGQIAQLTVKIAEARLTLEQMDREIGILRRTFDSLSDRLQEARIAKAESESSIRVVESAIPPREPVAPRRLLNLGMGGVLGLFLGTILASFRWYMVRGLEHRGGKREGNGEV